MPDFAPVCRIFGFSILRTNSNRHTIFARDFVEQYIARVVSSTFSYNCKIFVVLPQNDPTQAILNFTTAAYKKEGPTFWWIKWFGQMSKMPFLTTLFLWKKPFFRVLPLTPTMMTYVQCDRKHKKKREFRHLNTSALLVKTSARIEDGG